MAGITKAIRNTISKGVRNAATKDIFGRPTTKIGKMARATKKYVGKNRGKVAAGAGIAAGGTGVAGYYAYRKAKGGK